MKKGFTLIELLAVIIILAIIALITTPVVLNVIDSAKESANKSSITGYADATKLAVNEESFLNHGVAPIVNISWAIENVKYSGSEISCDGVYNSNTYGVLLHSCTVNSSSNKYCYVSGKVYNCDDEEYNSIYENSYAGGKVPVVELTPTEEANANGWINKDFFVRISSNGESYKYCVSDSECTPDTTVNSQSGLASVSFERENNYVCAQASNMLGDSEVSCSGPYKLDKTVPTLTAKEGPYKVGLGVSYETKNFFNDPIYGISNGSMICNPTNTSGLAMGTYTVGCTATSTSGLSTTVNIDVVVRNVVTEFTYTGGYKTYTVPETGNYKLEVWGAQGSTSGGNTGGSGGYSVGEISLTANTVLYIYVGGMTCYNGGGGCGTAYCGGGATHIATVSGTLSALSSQKSKVLIVAGGGGGTGRYTGSKGGSGGGTTGYSGYQHSGASGTQTTGYAFGQGGSNYTAAGGGGGGWYGGYGSADSAGDGAGGSGYIGGLTNATTSNAVRTGNGYAKITILN